MGFISRIDHHAELLNRMAETVHADFGAAMAAGTLRADEIRGAVFACMNCAGATQCPSWMELHQAGAEAAPEYCRNRGLLARISA